MSRLDELKKKQDIGFGRVTIFLSLLVFLSAFLAIRAENTDHQNQIYLFKVVTMLLVIAVAWLAIDPPSIIYKRLIVSGLAISLVGDVLLMLPSDLFLPGLVAFLVAQIVYTIGFIKVGGFYRSIWGALPFVTFGIVVLYFLAPGLDDMFVPVLFYLVAIFVMVWQAFGQWRQTGETRALFALIGAIFFVVSDTALAFNRFDAPIAQASLIILGTYFLAQWLIALSAGSEHP
jgi:uncharacterized membrane protein YhhN